MFSVNTLDKSYNSKQQGNTIVEVLLALAISGAVIATAIASVNNSTQSVQQYQERTEAVKVAESQLEAVRARFSSESEAVINDIKSSPGFCVVDSSIQEFGLSGIVDFSDPVDNVIQNLSSGFPSDCFFDERYGAHMIYDDSQNRLTITVRWLRVGGGVDQVRIVYGLHEVINV